jgi:hypothetical protein
MPRSLIDALALPASTAASRRSAGPIGFAALRRARKAAPQETAIVHAQSFLMFRREIEIFVASSPDLNLRRFQTESEVTHLRSLELRHYRFYGPRGWRQIWTRIDPKRNFDAWSAHMRRPASAEHGADATILLLVPFLRKRDHIEQKS